MQLWSETGRMLMMSNDILENTKVPISQDLCIGPDLEHNLDGQMVPALRNGDHCVKSFVRKGHFPGRSIASPDKQTDTGCLIMVIVQCF